MNARTLKIHYDEVMAANMTTLEVKLCQAAKRATQLAYAPYSKFYVGAAALLSDEQIILAANLENAAYPQCLCAEATLLGTLHTQHAQANIVAIAVAVRSDHHQTEVAAPCGSCRQQLLEAERRNKAPIQLYLTDDKGNALRFKAMADLLPFGFRF